MDDAQYVPDDTFSAIRTPSCTSTAATTPGCAGAAIPGGCGRREGATLAKTSARIKQISAVSDTLALIVDAAGKVQELNGTMYRPLDNQPPATPLKIEADPLAQALGDRARRPHLPLRPAVAPRREHAGPIGEGEGPQVLGAT